MFFFSCALVAFAGTTLSKRDSDGRWKIHEDDPLSIERFQYWGCNDDGQSKCGNRMPAPLKRIDPPTINSTTNIRSIRDPDGWVQRLPASQMDPTTFYNDYVLKHRPVVLTNISSIWAATSKWDDTYIKSSLAGYQLRMETKDDDKDNVPDGMSPDAFFSSYNTTSGLYLVDELPPTLHKDFGVPDFMQCENITAHFFVSYIWMSAGNTASKMHVDTDENLLFVLRGQKVLTLVSPLFSSTLHADESRVMGVLDQNVDALYLRQWSRYSELRYMMAEVNAGDGIFLPQNWWHKVKSTAGPQLAVSTWWKSHPKQREIPAGIGALGRYFKGKVVKTSYATVLENYARSVLTDPPVHTRCIPSAEPKTMADYEFATDREDFVKVGTPESWYESKSDDTKSLRDEELWCPFSHSDPRSPCYFRGCSSYAGVFDPTAKKWIEKVERQTWFDPDYAAVMDDLERHELSHQVPNHPSEGPGGGGCSYRCIRYILDYCHAKLTNDPQCWVQLANLLTKVSQVELRVLRRKRSELMKPGGKKVPDWAQTAQARFEASVEENRQEWSDTWKRRHAADKGQNNRPSYEVDDHNDRSNTIRSDL